MQEHFSQDYQLLRDVLTRWSSTLLMIEQVLKLKDVNLHITDIIYANHYIGNWGHNSWQWIQGAAKIPVNWKRLEFIRRLSKNPPSNSIFSNNWSYWYKPTRFPMHFRIFWVLKQHLHCVTQFQHTLHSLTCGRISEMIIGSGSLLFNLAWTR